VSNLRLLNPDFEYRFFDDRAVEGFIDVEYPEYRALFDAFPFRIQKYDFFRYLAVYRYGGFYFDLDVLLAAGLNPLLEHSCVFPFEGLGISRYLRAKHGMDWDLGNYAFGASAGHPFLGAIIENCVRAQRDAEWVTPMMHGVPFLSREQFYVLNSTGPGLVSRTFAEDPESAADVSILFPEDVCDPDTWNRFGEYGTHMHEGSWRDKQSFIRRKLADYFELRVFRQMRAQSVRLGKTRRLSGKTTAAKPD